MPLLAWPRGLRFRGVRERVKESLGAPAPAKAPLAATLDNLDSALGSHLKANDLPRLYPFDGPDDLAGADADARATARTAAVARALALAQREASAINAQPDAVFSQPLLMPFLDARRGRSPGTRRATR